MRVLIFHGYLLRGTGSNVYNAELAQALVNAGHEVHMVCQDRDPLSLDWVDAAADWDGGSLAVEARREPVRATVYRPDIGGLLPLYVADRYEGTDARPFPDLSEEELDTYIERNVAAVREVAERAKPDVALANHLVMGPLILARALTDVPYAVKIHGSALEYVVKPHPRFLPHAREGLERASGILVGSRHTAESLWAALDDDGLPGRTRLGPPGVDVERFAPREPEAARAGLQALGERLATLEEAEREDSFARDAREAAAALRSIGPEDRLVVYVGKLIASKGVELLLGAWPLIRAREPRAKLLVVGFGAFREGLESLAAALDAGDLDAARAIHAESGAELTHLAGYLAAADVDYLTAARGMAADIAWAGRLEHSELADVLPAAEAMVVPSTFPEAFGMVAAEGAATAALPVVARHSGLAEVARTLSEAVPAEARDWLTFDVGPGAVTELAAAVSGWLEAPDELRAATRAGIVQATRERYSWAGVARSVIAAAQGRLDDLPEA
jgi:glycosyltransferase involved in cell wall biosynthesis